MRRKDRLLELISILRDGQVHRGEDLARKLQVSDRTIYRDMGTLISSGIPIGGERGVGYQMNAPVTLPPINLSMKELEALHLGVAVVAKAADEDLQDAAKSLAEKLDQALPEDRMSAASGWGLAVFPFADAAAAIKFMPPIRNAIRDRKKLHISYRDMSGDMLQSVIRPLKLDYWGRVWSCRAWCEYRKDFRAFRLDQIVELTELDARFRDDPGKRIADFNSRSTS